jgi:L-arabinose isomerase
MAAFENYEIWFITGSQHLYGQKTLEQVAADSQEIVNFLNHSNNILLSVSFKPIVTTAEEIINICRQANTAPNCIGLICWMHTFSPAKMWIAGLASLAKPFLHLHTQFNREIPWDKIDMDFMNLNQSAHGDREFGFIGTRMQQRRKVVVGHYKDDRVLEQIDTWARAAVAHIEMQSTRIARFGDNMRDVAVTEGNKVSAQIELGYSVHGFGVGDLVAVINQIGEDSVDTLVSQYMDEYNVAAKLRQTKEFSQLREAAKIEIGLRNFLEDGNFTAFTTTFEDLNGLSQLPGLACQRLMKDGYGFGAEGDWKTAALVRTMKIMDSGLKGGTSFMEDYTYHLPEDGPAMVLGAHMLEVCPSIAADKPSLEIHPLSIGGKADPARLVFTTKAGPAINATLLDLGNRFRMLINEVEVVAPERSMPNLPVAKALWVPQPDLEISAAAWIYGGGAHHTGFSQAITTDHLRDYCDMLGIECLVIEKDTRVSEFKNELRYNHLYYAMAGAMQ